MKRITLAFVLWLFELIWWVALSGVVLWVLVASREKFRLVDERFAAVTNRLCLIEQEARWDDLFGKNGWTTYPNGKLRIWKNGDWLEVMISPP